MKKRRLFSIATCLCLLVACSFAFTGCSKTEKVLTASEGIDSISSIMYKTEAAMELIEANAQEDLENIDTYISASMIPMGFQIAGSSLSSIRDFELGEYSEGISKVDGKYIVKGEGGEEDTIVTVKYSETQIKISSQEISIVITIEDNYVKADAITVEDGIESRFISEIYFKGNNVYVQAYSCEKNIEDQTAEVEHSLITGKYNHTTDKTTNKVTINSYSLLLDSETETAPKSLKDVDLKTFATGETAVTYTAPVEE